MELKKAPTRDAYAHLRIYQNERAYVDEVAAELGVKPSKVFYHFFKLGLEEYQKESENNE